VLAVTSGADEARVLLRQYSGAATFIDSADLGSAPISTLLNAPLALGRAVVRDYKVHYTELSGLATLTPGAPAKRQVRAVELRSCWSRAADADADALGLPKSFCLSRAELAERPFEEGKADALKIAGSPVHGAFPLYLRESETGYTLNSEIFRARSGGSCSDEVEAALTASFAIDRSGKFLSASPAISAAISRPEDDCEGGMRSREILYTPEAAR
jgi:hypothetical protein